jgi:hypothetical protein
MAVFPSIILEMSPSSSLRAVSGNLNMLIGFRFLQGVARSTPIAIGGGTIADLFVQKQRGGLFIYVWAIQYHIFWFVPIFGTTFVGLGLIATFVSDPLSLIVIPHPVLAYHSRVPTQSYFVAALTLYASSAIAACTVLRSLLGALLPLAGPFMYAALGCGWEIAFWAS